ncbi:MAG: DNA polymerase III subunit beta [Candidatus Saganbacteria bacterium]|nr:DNA polymerase III subunit beta [Candidatus Saganbacteria bacterium]
MSTTHDPLAGLLGSNTDGKIYLAATDLEIGIRVSVDGQVTEGGPITIPAKKFAAMVKEMTDSEIHLVTMPEDKISITCGSARFKIAGLPADEFPPLINEKDNDKKLSFVSMDSNVLLTMIQQTSFAASREETRHFLNGVHISLKEILVKMAATDGKRLAVATANLDDATTEEKQGIIPTKAVERLKEMLTYTVIVKICLDNSRIIFDMGDITLVSRLIEGEYPDYEKVIPVENGIRLTMDTQRLLSIIKRIGTMANPKTPGLTMETTGDILKVKASTLEYGEGCEETQIKKEGDDISIGLNAQYLMDILKATDRDEVVFSMSDPLKPILMKPVGNDGYVCVIMPMRL